VGAEDAERRGDERAVGVSKRPALSVQHRAASFGPTTAHDHDTDPQIAADLITVVVGLRRYRCSRFSPIRKLTVSQCSGEESMKHLVQAFVRDEQGQDLIEYGLLVGVITVGAIVSIQAIGPKVATYFSNLNTKLK
jgi:pilus assembly protein Flp/PilA